MSEEQMPIDRIEAALVTWAAQTYVDGAHVSDVVKMPGNAGLSFGFTVSGIEREGRRVIRLSPPGVAKRGNTDVLRQVPLLNALDRAGIPVAAIEFSTEDPRWFGTDGFIQKFLDGQLLPMTDPPDALNFAELGAEPFVENAARTLARIHAVDWQAELPDWEQPRDLAADVQFWRKLQDKAAESAMAESADKLAVALLGALPANPRRSVSSTAISTPIT